MSFSTIKKHIARCNQRFVSCFIPFFNLKKLIDSYKAFYEDVQKRVIDCLEPNPNARKLAWASAAVNKIQGNTNNENYPHAERFLSDCFLEYGKQLSQQPGLSLALIQCGEAYNKIAESKNQSVDETKSGCLQPISERLHRDIRKISVLRKKVENKRLTFAHRKNVLEKTNAHPDQAFEECRIQYEDALAASTAAMSNFLDTEVITLYYFALFIFVYICADSLVTIEQN
ncbi:endophilin-A [Schistosoma bovis]|uniref:Endophilin-A n=1 Tax=Schistosoma bovis TaxID=6184 RepID=A0A430PZJ3_SCHBO|nr:endophilin-A [Schistosoma bovis]